MRRILSSDIFYAYGIDALFFFFFFCDLVSDGVASEVYIGKYNKCLCAEQKTRLHVLPHHCLSSNHSKDDSL